MKQIVPFEKKISFNTSIDEITSISLDKTVKNIEDSIISGVFDLYLEYKESDISVNVLKYSSSIPFDIDIDSKYSLKNVKVDIDDFYYDIEGDNVILHIDVLIDNLEYIEEELENIIVKHEERDEVDENKEEYEIPECILTEEKEEEITVTDKENNDERNNQKDDFQVAIEDLFKEVDEKIVDVETDSKIPIFETFDPKNETFVTYNVHIVREEDNIETICLKYGVTKEELSYYNDISTIKMGDKLIVPTYKK